MKLTENSIKNNLLTWRQNFIFTVPLNEYIPSEENLLTVITKYPKYSVDFKTISVIVQYAKTILNNHNFISCNISKINADNQTNFNYCYLVKHTFICNQKKSDIFC